MKRRILQSSQSPGAAPTVPRLWSSIEELSGDPAFQAWVDAEYPAAAEFASTARREFLKLMGASFVLAGLTGCEKSPFVAALPYVTQPEDETTGIPRYYATAVTLDGYAQPVIATTYSGRPTKLDGNPDHPVTQGRSDIFMQAAVLQLYDPDRAQGPTRQGEPVTWNDVAANIERLRDGWNRRQGEGLRLLVGPTTSPTLLRQIDGLVKTFPKARVHLHEPIGTVSRRELSTAAYGEGVELNYVLDQCDVVVSFDDDFLGPGPHQVRNARGWSASRRRFSDRPGIRLYAAESIPGATGAIASSRLAVDASRMPMLAEALANKLGIGGASLADLTSAERGWIDRAGVTCSEAKDRSLITSGPFGDPATAIWAARINETLKGAGQTLQLHRARGGPCQCGNPCGACCGYASRKGRLFGHCRRQSGLHRPRLAGLQGRAATSTRVAALGLQRDETGERCDGSCPSPTRSKAGAMRGPSMAPRPSSSLS